MMDEINVSRAKIPKLEEELADLSDQGPFISLVLKCIFLTVQDMNIRLESNCKDTNLEFSLVT